MEGLEPLRNALGIIQSLHNCLEASTKRHDIFNEAPVEEDYFRLRMTLKSLTVARWPCRWKAVKYIIEQLEGIVRTLLKLSEDKNAKTYGDARCLLKSICDVEFVLGLSALKVILCSTSNLSRYLQGKSIDVISAKRAADMAIKSLRTCRTDEGLSNYGPGRVDDQAG